MRIFVNYTKEEAVRYISHLDMQRLLQRALRRANVPLAYSQGFNPHPLFSFASALAVGYTSENEWLDVRLEIDMDPNTFLKSVNAVLPDGIHLIQAVPAPETLPTLTALTQSARYRVLVALDEPLDTETVERGMDTLLSGSIVVTKHTKGGYKQVDIRPQVQSITWSASDDTHLTLYIQGCLNTEGSLNIELLMNELLRTWKTSATWSVHRTDLFFHGTELLPCQARG